MQCIAQASALEMTPFPGCWKSPASRSIQKKYGPARQGERQNQQVHLLYVLLASPSFILRLGGLGARHSLASGKTVIGLSDPTTRVYLGLYKFSTPRMAKDETHGTFEPRLWHQDHPQRPKVWPMEILGSVGRSCASTSNALRGIALVLPNQPPKRVVQGL
jgi:hypothetical protein